MKGEAGASLGYRWHQLQGNALFAYSRLVTRTSHFQIEGWSNREEAEETGRPLLWSLWHGQMMVFLSFGDRYLDPSRFVAVTVGDERGDTLSTFGTRLGGKAYKVDMEGNPFAAGRAVLHIVRAMRNGHYSVLAPDGPDGPAFVPKPGVAFLARKAQAAVLPIGVWTRQAFQLPRWDRYLVPLPFANFHVTIGKPILVEDDADEVSLLARISEALHAARARAQILAGVRPWR